MANKILILSKTLSFQLSATNIAIVEKIMDEIVMVDNTLNLQLQVVVMSATNAKKTAH